MEVYFRLLNTVGGKRDAQIIKNYTLTSEESKEFVIYPVPPFLKDPKCKCGKPAQLIINDDCACVKCTDKLLGKTRLVKTDAISVPLTEGTIKSLKFEWSVNGDRWYTIYGRGLKPENWDRFIKKLRDAILRKKELTLEVDYDKDIKQMTIY